MFNSAMMKKYEVVRDCNEWRLVTYTCNGCYMLTVKRSNNKEELIDFANKHFLKITFIEKQ